MRIGELAAKLGVSTRTIRYYHRRGLLPEPARRSNGYRDYTVPDAVRLARIRRLVGLGLGLDDVGRALDSDGGGLGELLSELDADLARQEREIRRRRERIAQLQSRAVAGVDEVVPSELAALLDGIGGLAGCDGRGQLALIEDLARPAERQVVREMTLRSMRHLAADPVSAARLQEIYRTLDELADEPLDEERIAALASATAEASASSTPPEILEWIRQDRMNPDEALKDAGLPPLHRAVFAEALRRLAAHWPTGAPDPGRFPERRT